VRFTRKGRSLITETSFGKKSGQTMPRTRYKLRAAEMRDRVGHKTKSKLLVLSQPIQQIPKPCKGSTLPQQDSYRHWDQHRRAVAVCCPETAATTSSQQSYVSCLETAAKDGVPTLKVTEKNVTASSSSIDISVGRGVGGDQRLRPMSYLKSRWQLP
jgi:hypothetical protein